MQPTKSPLRLLIILMCTSGLVGCAFVFEDEYETAPNYHWPESRHYEFQDCESDSPSSYCGKKRGNDKTDYSWTPNCNGDSCQPVGFQVHNTVKQDLGKNGTLWIEAYDNHDLQGQPVASMKVFGFSMSKHTGAREELYLEPGEYYLRAFMSNQNENRLPSDFDGLSPIDKAEGQFAVISLPVRVLVEPYTPSPLTHIYLDQLYEDPNNSARYQAKLRIKITSPEELFIPNDRQLHIQLLDRADIDRLPQHEYIIPSSNLLVMGKKGQTQYVTDAISPDDYYLFVFLDEDGNHYYDYGELAYFHWSSSEPAAITLEEKKTKSIIAPLRLEPMLP